MNSNEHTPRLIRLPEVMGQTGNKRTTIYDAIRAKTFPQPVPLGGRNVAWVQSEVDDWIASRIAARGMA